MIFNNERNNLKNNKKASEKRKPAIEFNIQGIKCDNESCDYKNKNVNVDDYPNWLNKPCPKCGSILLTEKDYNYVLFIKKVVKILNFILPKRRKNSKVVKQRVRFNGTGELKFDNLKVVVKD